MSHSPYYVSREQATPYIADFVRRPIASTFMPGSIFTVLLAYTGHSIDLTHG